MSPTDAKPGTTREAVNNLPGPDLDERTVEWVAKAIHRSWCDSDDEAAREWSDESRRWNYMLDARTAIRALKRSL